MKKEKNFNFAAGDIGEALAFIVSKTENEEYIFEYVNYYATYWNRGLGFTVNSTTRLSIVKKGYEDLYFIENHKCPWMIDKVSHPITCIWDPYSSTEIDYYRTYDPYKTRKGNFEYEFKDNPNTLKVNPFPYLDEFIQNLATLQSDKTLTKDEIMQLAQTFVTTKSEKKEKKYGSYKKRKQLPTD